MAPSRTIFGTAMPNRCVDGLSMENSPKETMYICAGVQPFHKESSTSVFAEISHSKCCGSAGSQQPTLKFRIFSRS